MAKAGSTDVHDMNSGFPGAQSPARLVKVLRLLTRHHVQGLSIADLTALSGLDRSTARRLLMVLVQSGYAAKDADTGRYRLGVEAMLTGLAAMAKPPIFGVCHPVMVSVARRTGDTVFLIIRVGDFAHCLHVQPGSTVLPAHSLMTGQIRLLGQGTASLALAGPARRAPAPQPARCRAGADLPAPPARLRGRRHQPGAADGHGAPDTQTRPFAQRQPADLGCHWRGAGDRVPDRPQRAYRRHQRGQP